jgi:hypothetical protein
MLASEPVPVAIFDDEPEGPVPATGSAEALAAVERLTTLFAWASAPRMRRDSVWQPGAHPVQAGRVFESSARRLTRANIDRCFRATNAIAAGVAQINR